LFYEKLSSFGTKRVEKTAKREKNRMSVSFLVNLDCSLRCLEIAELKEDMPMV
tara:strand:- start:163 stop:321 length:159 start_codon:yes stop_codon:yes gene_type:complete